MENTNQLNSSLRIIPNSALVIEKVHSCADCPIRMMAIKQPHSIFARLHAWHRTWWPGWKAHQMRTCPLSANTSNQS